MTITTRDELIDSLANRCQNLISSKFSIGNAVLGQTFSLWRATGQPAQAAIPAAAAVCTQALAGAFTWTNPVSPMRSYLARATMMGSNNASEIQVHDRLIHMGGLSGIVTTAQTVGTDASLTGERIGDANYSDVQWWLEWYTDTGTTAVSATVAFTYSDNTTSTVVVALAASQRAGRMMPIQSPVAGKFIKSIQSVTLSATTGTAGSFGVTAMRLVTSFGLGVANTTYVADWAQIGLPRIFDNSCLQLVCFAAGSTTGAFYGQIKLVQG